MIFKLLKRCVVLLTGIFLLSACRKQAFEDYYGRPDTLQPPIYQVLESKPNFKTLLTLIDRSGYKTTLSTAGFWTFFAPNDAAFQKYFTDNSISLDRIDSITARKLVQYALVYNAFETNRIADYQAATGWVINSAYKRRTTFYEGFYLGTGPEGAATVLLSANRNAGQNGTSFLFGDNNNKYIPYFYASYMSANGLSATDYNALYPNTTYTGFNVADAQVVNRNILAENGVIHEIDRVVLPLPNLERYLADGSQYSEFRKVLEQFMVSYVPNTDATARYNILSGKKDKVYIKQYSNLLAFSPGNENFLKLADNDGQSDGYSMMVPNNTAFTQYLNSVILEYYGTVDKLPFSIVADLMNAHLYNTTAWPSKLGTINNYLNEPTKLSLANDIIDRKMCSNGIFYGTNKVQPAQVFSTVYARAYLDPAYSLMWRILSNNKISISNPGLRWTIFMLPDVLLRSLGYDYNTATAQFTYTINGSTVAGAGPQSQLQRIVDLHVIATPANELNSLAGQGILPSFGGEYVKWNNNTIFAGGNLEKNQTVGVGAFRDYSNGRIYYLTGGSMEYPIGTLASQIAKNATTPTSPYYDFYQYLINSTAYNTVALEIAGLVTGGNYTIFIPTKAAIQQAVRDGFLPGTIAGTVVTPTYNPASLDDKAKVTRFIQYHMLNGVAIASDGRKSATASGFQTFLTNSLGDKLELVIRNQPGNLTITDNAGRVANVVEGNTSNYLGTRSLFHQIDNYLRYNF